MVEEKTPAQKRAEERERRQKRIREAGSSRMAKITGVAGTKDYKEPKEPSLRAYTEPEDDSDPVVPSISDTPAFPMNPGLQSAFNSSGGPPDLQTLLAMMSNPESLKAAQQMGQTPGGIPGGNNASAAQTKARAKKYVDSRYFDSLRLIIFFLLGVYSACSPIQGVFPLFTVLELGMFSLQYTVGQSGFSLSDLPFIGMFTGMIPSGRRNQLQYAGMAFMIARSAYRDLAVFVFAFGICSLGADYSRIPV